LKIPLLAHSALDLQTWTCTPQTCCYVAWWHVNGRKLACLVHWCGGTILLKDEFTRDLLYGAQQLLW